LTDRQLALTLAIARVESGFNPDAAAGTTSALGLGQFVDRTGTAYGLDEHNRFDSQAQADALVQETLNNMGHALQQGHGGKDLERYAYAYHHDGWSKEQGGFGLADERVLPLVGVYQQYLENR
jgi:putative chitinase